MPMKWLQVSQFNTYSKQHYSLIGTQLKRFKYYYLALIILFNIMHSIAHFWIVPSIIMYHK